MPPEAAEALAAARRAYMLAAAGCGKTESIARAAGIHDEGRQLVLTHTHAGVKALKDRLRKIGVTPGRVHVDTIAGFALAYAAAYPRRSGIQTVEPRTNEDWTEVYGGAVRVIDGALGRRVLTQSYAGLYVDEYQDCSDSQHALIMSITELLPCRIVLDPMQAVFDFAGPLASVDDLDPGFERLPDLTTPWRWRGKNDELGDWLVAARAELENGRPLDLRGAPVDRGDTNRPTQLTKCNQAAGRSGSVVAIGQWPGDCHSIGRSLRGVFTCMESVECPDLMVWAARIEEATGAGRAGTVIDFAADCMTRVGTALRPARDLFADGRLPPPRGAKEVQAAVQALVEVARTPDLSAVLEAMAAVEAIPGRVLFRREMWREMQRTVRAFAATDQPTLPGAAWHVRDGGRQRGRRVDERTISRTVLVKGLEFDNVVVLDADRHDVRNLYVALTRASSSLTVLSRDDLLTPTG